MARTPKRNPQCVYKQVCYSLVVATKEQLELGLLPKCDNCEAKERKIDELMGVHKEDKREKIIENNLLQLQSFTQTCKKCGVEKPIKKFTKDNRGTFGRRRVCKSCVEDSKYPELKDEPYEEISKEEYREIWESWNPGKSYDDWLIRKRENIRDIRKHLKWKALNKSSEGCERHHINSDYVINMPQPLHILYGHRLNDAESMTKVNELAFKYLLSNQDSIIVPIELIHELKNKLLE